MASRTLLLAAGPFEGELDDTRVASAVGRGLQAGGRWQLDLCPLTPGPAGKDVRGFLDALDFDSRMRAARAVVVLERCLNHRLLPGGVAFEIATRARQAGVPAYAITLSNELDRFGARMLDLQLILEGGSERALHTAARRLAKSI